MQETPATTPSGPLVRDPINIDPTTDKPFCHGHQSPDALICMMCTFEQTCRELKKANKAAGGNASGFFEVEDDPFDDSDEDLPDEDFDE